MFSFQMSRCSRMKRAKGAIVKLEDYTAALREARKERPSNLRDPD